MREIEEEAWYELENHGYVWIVRVPENGRIVYYEMPKTGSQVYSMHVRAFEKLRKD